MNQNETGRNFKNIKEIVQKNPIKTIGKIHFEAKRGING